MKRRWARGVGITFAVLLVTWAASSFVALEFLRRRSAPPRPEPMPTAWEGRCESLRLATADGEQLGAWRLDSEHPDAPTVVLLHGKGGARSSRVGAAEIFLRRGCAVLLVTLRAHGDSSGEREDFGWSARRDVVAAVDSASRWRPKSRIVVCGASLGGAAAIFAAKELDTRVDGYILECVFTDLDTAAWRRCQLHLPPVLDRMAYLGLRGAAALAWPEWTRISPLEQIGSLPPTVPVLLLAGGADRRSSLDEARALYSKVAYPVGLVIIEAAEHDRLVAADPAAYEQAVAAFLRSLPPGSR